MEKDIKTHNNGKFNPACKKAILDCYRNGIETKDHICAYLGIHHNTLNNWIKEGKITEEEILKVKLENKVLAVDTILKAMRNARADVALRAAQWWLERKYSQEYSNQYEERYIQSEMLKVTTIIIDILKNEISDQETLRRIGERLGGVCKSI